MVASALEQTLSTAAERRQQAINELAAIAADVAKGIPGNPDQVAALLTAGNVSADEFKALVGKCNEKLARDRLREEIALKGTHDATRAAAIKAIELLGQQRQVELDTVNEKYNAQIAAQDTIVRQADAVNARADDARDELFRSAPEPDRAELNRLADAIQRASQEVNRLQSRPQTGDMPRLVENAQEALGRLTTQRDDLMTKIMER